MQPYERRLKTRMSARVIVASDGGLVTGKSNHRDTEAQSERVSVRRSGLPKAARRKDTATASFRGAYAPLAELDGPPVNAARTQTRIHAATKTPCLRSSVVSARRQNPSERLFV